MMIKMNGKVQSMGWVVASLFSQVTYAAPDAQKDCVAPYQFFRMATANDYACVTQNRPSEVAAENAAFIAKLYNDDGSCSAGVFRLATATDKTCVTVASRKTVEDENNAQPQRKAPAQPSGTPSGTPSGGKWGQLGTRPPIDLGLVKPDRSVLQKQKTVTITADQIPSKYVNCARVEGAVNQGVGVVAGNPMLCVASLSGDSETIKHDYTDTVSLDFINPHFKIAVMGIQYKVALDSRYRGGLAGFRLIDVPFDKSRYENKNKDRWGENGGIYIYGNANMVVAGNVLTLTRPMWQSHTSPFLLSSHSNEFLSGSSVSITVTGPANEDPIKR